MAKWPRQSGMAQFFGNPAASDGTLDPAWEKANIVYIEPPYQLYYDGKPVSKIRCHKLVRDSLLRILTRIREDLTPAEIRRYGLDQFGGVFEYRKKRSGTTLSTHSYAAAIDLAPLLNPFKVKYGSRQNMMPMKVVQIFQAEGWVWGGLWSNGDAMHFQAALLG